MIEAEKLQAARETNALLHEVVGLLQQLNRATAEVASSLQDLVLNPKADVQVDGTITEADAQRIAAEVVGDRSIAGDIPAQIELMRRIWILDDLREPRCPIVRTGFYGTSLCLGREHGDRPHDHFWTAMFPQCRELNGRRQCILPAVDHDVHLFGWSA